MITRYLKAPPFDYIEVIVTTQLYMVAGLAVLTMALLLYRNWNLKRVARFREQYATNLIQEVLTFTETRRHLPAFTAPRRLEITKRATLQSVLLEHISTFSGPEKVYLTFRYEQLGFSATDQRWSRSIFWWIRLKGLANLNRLALDRFAPIFEELTRDRHPLVSAFAYIPLSQLDHELNRVQPIESLPLAVLSRKNVMHEILRNWSLVHGHEFLLEQIKELKRPELITHLIKAVSVIQSPEIAAVLAEKLADPRIPVEALEQILIILRQVGDPDSAGAVTNCLTNPDETIRLRAVEYFVATGNLEPLIATNLRDDPSVVVRRLLQSLKLAEAA